MTDEFVKLTATAAGAEIARGAISAEDYTRACLDRIEAVDGEIKAFVHLDRAHAPGGSSSGSAAAVAARMVPLALGSQTNGSVIRPAAFCGVFAVKPSHGLVSRAGVLPLSRKLDHIGAFARSIPDLALILEVIAGQDPADPDTGPFAAPDFRALQREPPPLPPRFAFGRTPVWDKAGSHTKAE